MTQRQGCVEHDLHRRARSRCDRRTLQHHHAREPVAGAGVEVHRRAVAQRPRFASEQPQVGIEAGGHGGIGTGADPGAAGRRLPADAGASDGQRQALAGAALLRLAVPRMEGANAGAAPAGQHDDLVADAHPALQRRAGDHRSHAAQGEGAVDRQAEQATRADRRRRGSLGDEPEAQRVEAFAAARRYEDRVLGSEGRADEGSGDLGGHGCAAVGGDAVALGHDDEPARQAEQAQDLEVLASLQHDPVVGGDHQQCEVDAGGAGDHGAHEALVAGHVNEADRAAALQGHVREAEIDGDPARHLLLETIGIDASQRAHQRGLAVIDMAGGADDHALKAARQAPRTRPWRSARGRATRQPASRRHLRRVRNARP